MNKNPVYACPVCDAAFPSELRRAGHIANGHLRDGNILCRCWCNSYWLPPDCVSHLLDHNVEEHFLECALGVQ